MKDTIIPKVYRDLIISYNNGQRVSLLEKARLFFKGHKFINLKMAEVSPSDFDGLPQFEEERTDGTK